MYFRVFQVRSSLSFLIISLHDNYFKKEKKYCFKKTFLKWDYSDDFIADFDTDGDITLLKCKIAGSTQPKLAVRLDRVIYVAKFLIAFCRILTT